MLESFCAYRTENTGTVVAIENFQRDAIERTKLILYEVKENNFWTQCVLLKKRRFMSRVERETFVVGEISTV